MNIPDKAYEAVTAALLRASDGINADMIYDHEAEWFAKAAVEAATPFIAAQALRDAARESEEDDRTSAWQVVRDMRRSADKLEARA